MILPREERRGKKGQDYTTEKRTSSGRKTKFPIGTPSAWDRNPKRAIGKKA